MTLSTIQPIGKKPVTAPRTVARSDMSAGIVKMKMATQVGDNQRDDRRDMRLDLAGCDKH